jgi:hypothetical protein
MGIFIKKYIAIFLLTLLVSLAPFGACSFAESPIESKVKAAFVVNFARFINWPQDILGDNGGPLVICTVGVEEGNQIFAGVESKKIKGRPVVVQKINTLEESSGVACQLLYVDGAAAKPLLSYLQKSGSSPVVTISEMKDFARLGGIIEFVKIKDRLSFKINNSAAKERRLQISASLLDLAEEVY